MDMVSRINENKSISQRLYTRQTTALLAKPITDFLCHYSLEDVFPINTCRKTTTQYQQSFELGNKTKVKFLTLFQNDCESCVLKGRYRRRSWRLMKKYCF